MAGTDFNPNVHSIDECRQAFQRLKVILGAGGLWPMDDELFSLMDDTDNTKLLQFELSSITTATTRVATVPDSSFTMAGINIAQSWSADQTFAAGSDIIMADFTAKSFLYADASKQIKSTGAPTDGQLLIGATGAIPAVASVSGDATLAASGALTLATVNANVGTFGSATQVAQATVNAKGLVTAISNVTIVSLYTVEAKTATTALATGDNGKTITNEGATTAMADRVVTLPSAAANLVFTFVIQDADGMRVKANTGDTIRIGADVSISAGYIECAVVGYTVTLVAINATEWVAVSVIGFWTIETS